MFENYPDIVNVKVMCEMLGIGKNKAYYLIHNNEIGVLYIGRIIKVPKKEIIRYIKNNLKKPE